MTIELPLELEAALKTQASLQGVSAEEFVREVIERELKPALKAQAPLRPFKSSYGLLAKYGPMPSAEEIDENRREMFQDFGKGI